MNLWLDVSKREVLISMITAHWWIAVVILMIRLMSVRTRRARRRTMAPIMMENCAKHKVALRKSELKPCAARILREFCFYFWFVYVYFSAQICVYFCCEWQSDICNDCLFIYCLCSYFKTFSIHVSI